MSETYKSVAYCPLINIKFNFLINYNFKILLIHTNITDFEIWYFRNNVVDSIPLKYSSIILFFTS